MTGFDRLAFLDGVALGRLSHDSLVDGACLMEAVSFAAGGPWTDRPACVPPTLAGLGHLLNDALADRQRQRLKAHIAALSALEPDSNADSRVRSALSAWVDNEADRVLSARGGHLLVDSVHAALATGPGLSGANRRLVSPRLSAAALSAMNDLLTLAVSAAAARPAAPDRPGQDDRTAGQVDRWLSARRTGQDTGQPTGHKGGRAPESRGGHLGRSLAVPPGATRRARPRAAARDRRPAPALHGPTGQVLHRAR